MTDYDDEPFDDEERDAGTDYTCLGCGEHKDDCCCCLECGKGPDECTCDKEADDAVDE